MSGHDIIRGGDPDRREGDQLPPNDYLRSPSQVYFAILEPSGDLDIYAGESPADPGKVKLWSTGSASRLPQDYEVMFLQLRAGPWDHDVSKLQIFAHHPHRGSTLIRLWDSGGGDLSSAVSASLGDDGKLSLKQKEREVWSNGFSDPLVEFSVDVIGYDVPRATIISDSDFGTIEQVLRNNSDRDQTMKMAQTTGTTVTSTWSNTTGLSATITGEVTAGVPGVASAKVSVSSTVTNSFTFGTAKAKSATIGFDYNLTVPAHRIYRGWATVRKAKFEVPYTVTGELTFRSGRKTHHSFSGTYQGENGYLGEYTVDDITDKNNPKLVVRNDGPILFDALATS